jgi:3-hydroxypropanoate dehydrogenase
VSPKRSCGAWDGRCDPMSGFEAAKVNDAFFAGSSWRANFLCNLGYGDAAKLHPRIPRLEFKDACRIV